jgi:hypothetical protein
VPARALIEPISEARYRIQLNASASLKEKLELFKALVRALERLSRSMIVVEAPGWRGATKAHTAGM